MLTETKPGVFGSKVSAAVRERLWNKVTQCQWENGALMIFSSDSEQGFSICMCGEPTRQVVDFEGIQLIKIKENP